MAIRPVPREVPNKLNPARLFLDDIEEIIRIFTDAENDRHEKPDHVEGENLTTTFQIGNQTCDELADLKKLHPPFTYEFLVRVERTGFNAHVSITKSGTSWYSYGLDDNDRWGTFHKLELIFDRRKLRWKSLLNSHARVSYWIYGAATALFILLIPTLSLRFLPHVPAMLQILVLPVLVILGVLLWFLRSGLSTHSIVIFRSHADHSSQRVQTAWKVIPDVVKIFLGFLLGALTLYLKHRYWP